MGERLFLVGGQRTFELIIWKKEREEQVQSSCGKNKLGSIQRTARRLVWLQNELKIGGDKSRGRMGSIHFGPSGLW